MLGNYSICEAPLAAFPEYAYVASLAESAAVSESTFVASSVFSGATSNTATTSDTVAATAAYPATVSDTATGSESVSSLAGFAASASEVATTYDYTSVAPSTFSANVSAGVVSAADQVVAYSVFIAAASGGATTADAVLSRFLWELIDDSQTPNWQNISTD